MNGTTDARFLDVKADPKVVLALAWTALLGLYIYCDIYSLFRPGILEEMRAGRMGPFDVSQASLALAALLMILPILAAPASILLPARAGRILNLVLAPLYFLVNIGNLLGEAWIYYYLFGILELALTAGIFLVALKWPKERFNP
mgnify:CR=1 FL=1